MIRFHICACSFGLGLFGLLLPYGRLLGYVWLLYGGAVLSLDSDSVEVDFNHPLAGQTVRFAVKIIKVENPPSAEIH